jgi:hypothetical protein
MKNLWYNLHMKIIPKWLYRRARFFRWWLGVFYLISAIAQICALVWFRQQSYYLLLGNFAMFWLSLGLYLVLRDPIKAEKALWDAVEKEQKAEKVAADVG